jgi:hypothetical protein
LKRKPSLRTAKKLASPETAAHRLPPRRLAFQSNIDICPNTRQNIAIPKGETNGDQERFQEDQEARLSARRQAPGLAAVRADLESGGHIIQVNRTVGLGCEIVRRF